MSSQKGQGDAGASNDHFRVRRTPEFSSKTFEGLFKLQSDEQLTDFVVVVGGRNIKCHRNVLAVGCPYFSALFNSNMSEAKKRKVTLSNLDEEGVSTVIQYLYTGAVNIPQGKVRKIIETCEFLELPELTKICVKYVISKLKPENCIEWLKTAEKYALIQLASEARKVMSQNISEVVTGLEFKQLAYEEIISLITDENLQFPNVDVRLLACMEWCNYEIERVKHLRPLLDLIQLEDCSFKCLRKVSSAFSELLSRADRDIERMLLRACVTASDRKAERLTTVTLAAGKVYKFWYLNAPNEWIHLTTCPREYYYPSATVCISDTHIALLGGYKRLVLPHVVMYSFASRDWHKRTVGMNSPRLRPSCIAVGKYIYVFGGENSKRDDADITGFSFETLNTAERLSVGVPGSTELPASPQAFYNRSITSAKEKIFIPGNEKLLVFDTSVNQWSCLDVPGLCVLNGSFLHQKCSVIALHSDVYLVGKSKEATDAMIMKKYDSVSKKWTYLKKPSAPVDNLLAFKGKILGFKGKTTTCFYNPKTDEWESTDIDIPYWMDQVQFQRIIKL